MKDDVDIDATLAPKSDQLDAIELAEPRTITVTRVTAGTGEQPLNVWFEGDNDRPWRPSKTVRRILRECWGKRGSDWVGKSCTLYNDRTVKYGGIEVGGVRVSHASHIAGPVVLMLPVTRGKFKRYEVQPLKTPAKREDRPPLDLAPATEQDAAFSALLADMRAAADVEQLAEVLAAHDMNAFSESQREMARAEYRAVMAQLEK
jgi:hypothetical protein